MPTLIDVGEIRQHLLLGDFQILPPAAKLSWRM
jgi:hypothetical protein